MTTPNRIRRTLRFLNLLASTTNTGPYLSVYTAQIARH